MTPTKEQVQRALEDTEACIEQEVAVGGVI